MIAVKWRRFSDGRRVRPTRVLHPGTDREWVEWEAEQAPQRGDFVALSDQPPPPPESFFSVSEAAGVQVAVTFFSDDGESSPDDTGVSGPGGIARWLRVPVTSQTGRQLSADELEREISWLVGREAEIVREETRLRRDVLIGRWNPQAIVATQATARRLPKCHHCGADRNETEDEHAHVPTR